LAAVAVTALASKRGLDPETPGGHAVAPCFITMLYLYMRNRFTGIGFELGY